MSFCNCYFKPGARTFIGVGVSVMLTLSGIAAASSHREAPFIAGMPKVDATDFYIFNSYEAGREDYVTLIANYLPLQDAYGGPNYFTLDNDAIYEIHIDNNGDAVEDLTFQFSFEAALPAGDEGVALTIGEQQVPVPLKAVGGISAGSNAGANFDETFTLNMIQGDRRSGQIMQVTDAVTGADTFTKPLDYFGEKTFGTADAYMAYASGLTNSGALHHDVVLPGCSADIATARVFVGQRKESFSVNLGRIFDLVNLDPINGVDDINNNDLEDKNITSLALEIHKDCLTGNGNGVIGGWTTASKRQFQVFNPNGTLNLPALSGGAYTQVSRLGNPLVNEVVIGLPDKNRFNNSEPVNDGQFATYVTNPTLPAIINLVFNSDGGLSQRALHRPTSLVVI